MPIAFSLRRKNSLHVRTIHGAALAWGMLWSLVCTVAAIYVVAVIGGDVQSLPLTCARFDILFKTRPKNACNNATCNCEFDLTLNHCMQLAYRLGTVYRQELHQALGGNLGHSFRDGNAEVWFDLPILTIFIETLLIR